MYKNSPIFTIVTICYNSARTIRKTIDSVNNQKCQKFEHIFVDGLSSDNTFKIIKKAAHINSSVISEPDTGIYNAMNKGIKHAQGEFICFLNSDDEFIDIDLLYKVELAIKKNYTDIIYTDLVYVSNKNSNRVTRYWKAGSFTSMKLKFGWMPPHPGTFIRKELLEKIGGFNEKYQISGDYDLLIRSLTYSDNPMVTYLPFQSVAMKSGGVSNRNLKNILLKTKEDYSVVKENGVGGILTVLFKNLRKAPQVLNFADFRWF